MILTNESTQMEIRNQETDGWDVKKTHLKALYPFLLVEQVFSKPSINPERNVYILQKHVQQQL